MTITFIKYYDSIKIFQASKNGPKDLFLGLITIFILVIILKDESSFNYRSL